MEVEARKDEAEVAVPSFVCGHVRRDDVEAAKHCRSTRNRERYL
jgi:hypothetical protein